MPVQFDEQNYAQTQYTDFDEPKGFSAKLINWGIAKDQRSANVILIIVLIVVVIFTGFVMFNRSDSANIEDIRTPYEDGLI